ncbi:MAG: hypothetical protein SFV81_21615, partial [Pirellulaceae bacterium]|nr:hypothetical protein [Pirellulaceae bacterium]
FIIEGVGRHSWDRLDTVGTIYKVVTDEDLYMPKPGEVWGGMWITTVRVQVVRVDNQFVEVEYFTSINKYKLEVFMRDYRRLTPAAS